MKKKIIKMVVMFLFFILIVACSDDDKNNTNDVGDKDNVEQKEDNSGELDSGEENEADEENDTDNGGSFEVKVEDQLNLGIGDTGSFDTTLGTYDVTLVSAKLEDEINGEVSELDKFIILDFIVKNTSQETQNVEDIIYSLEVAHILDGSGYPDGAEFFDGYEKLSGPLEPNEEMEGKFITFAYDSEEYYFRKNPGNVAAGSSNQVIWTIKAEEAQ